MPGDIFAGKLRLDLQVAAGGMGYVWRAWNMQLDIPVAVKFMAAAMVESPEFVARFEREARAATQIRSPHVVTIYEHGVHEGLPYMVMELLEGEDLSQRLKREKRLSLVATAHIVRAMCKALQGAHELGIVHRDLKPANVFLARDGDGEIVKILDFGIAKLTQDGGGNMTATGEIMGTPNYMSPEHIQASKHVDHRADLWSVSVIAFRLLTGQLPFTGHILDVVDRILTGSAPVPSSLAPDLPPAVDAFFARALTRNIYHRFQSARELSEALSRLVGHESLSEASWSPDTAGAVEDLPTIATRPTAAQPDAWAAVESTTHVVGLDIRSIGDHGSQRDFNAAVPGAEENPRGFLRTMRLDLPASVPPASTGLAREAPTPEAPSLLFRSVSGRPFAGPPWSRSWRVVVALVVMAAAFWASMAFRKNQAPKPAPVPAVSAR